MAIDEDLDFHVSSNRLQRALIYLLGRDQRRKGRMAENPAAHYGRVVAFELEQEQVARLQRPELAVARRLSEVDFIGHNVREMLEPVPVGDASEDLDHGRTIAGHRGLATDSARLTRASDGDLTPRPAISECWPVLSKMDERNKLFLRWRLAMQSVHPTTTFNASKASRGINGAAGGKSIDAARARASDRESTVFCRHDRSIAG